MWHRSSTAVIIYSEKWASIDFMDIEKSLAFRLTDDDVAAMLACVDAHNKLKTLKITGCINITGRGLEPLRGSFVLEHIDLSLVRLHDSPDMKCKSLLSEACVLPIIDDIVGTLYNSLALVHLPQHWYLSKSSNLHSFIGRYNILLESRRSQCSICQVRICSGDLALFRGKEWVEGADNQNAEYYGHQNFTCSKCVKFFCDQCRGLWFCHNCQKDYCDDCDPVEHCDDCDKDFCPDCRYLALKKDWKSACSGCFQIISGIIGQKIQDEKQEEHEKLLRENEILRREIKQMREKKSRLFWMYELYRRES